MRRTRIKAILIGALLLVIGVVVALVIRNNVAAEGEEEPACTLNIYASYDEENDVVIVGLSDQGSEAIQTLIGSISYDASRFSGNSVSGGCNINEEGTASLFFDGNFSGGTMFTLIPNDGVYGTGTVSLSVTTANTYSGAQIASNGSASFSIPEPEPGPGPGPGPQPEYPDPRLSPAEWTLSEALPQAQLICIHRGYDIESWSSSNEGLVTIESNGDNAIITRASGDAEGDATITVTFVGGKTATALIHVTKDEEPVIPVDPDEPVDPDDFPDIPVVEGAPVITPSGNQSMTVGQTLQMSADQAGVVWTSSDTSIAIVDSSTGLISAVGKGAAIISVSNHTGKTTNFYVIVNEQENGSNNNGNKSGNGSSTTNTTIKNGTTNSGKETPTADDPVPQTGESTAEYIVLVGIVTLVVAAIIFKIKSKRN